MSHGVLVGIFAVSMLAGVAGVLIPVIPGIPLMFVLSMGFGFADKFTHMGWAEYAVLLLIAVMSFAVDYASGILGARYGGAGRRSALIGIVGMMVGLAAFPPFGGLIGLFTGVLGAELLGRREGKAAVRAAAGSLLGSVAGIAVNFGLAVLFLVLFVVFALN